MTETSSQWRLRAEETRVIAEQMKHQASIRMLETLARDYDRMAAIIDAASVSGSNGGQLK